jgi:hypothetical protein
MQHTSRLHPSANDAPAVEARVSKVRIQTYNLVLAAGIDGHEITTSDPRVARDYFAAVAKAAQELVDAADKAILAEPLDLPVAVSA